MVVEILLTVGASGGAPGRDPKHGQGMAEDWQLKGVKLKKMWRVRESDLEAFLGQRKEPTTE